MLRPKKNSYKEFDDEKEFLRLENSPPPHNFSNGPSLSALYKKCLNDGQQAKVFFSLIYFLTRQSELGVRNIELSIRLQPFLEF